MLEVAVYSVDEVQLLPGDKVVVFSDGVSEAENRTRQMFEKHGLREAVTAHAGVGAAELHAALREAFEVFTEGEAPGDDVTWLVLEFGGSPS